MIFPYQLWKAKVAEIKALKEQMASKATLSEITDLYDEMVSLLNEMCADPECRQGHDHWKAKYHSIATRVTSKIDDFAGKPEAALYNRRGLIDRHIGKGLPPHQLEIDIMRHDVMHLREFLKSYSRQNIRS